MIGTPFPSGRADHFPHQFGIGELHLGVSVHGERHGGDKVFGQLGNDGFLVKSHKIYHICISNFKLVPFRVNEIVSFTEGEHPED